jgi:hypothetical protein
MSNLTVMIREQARCCEALRHVAERAHRHLETTNEITAKELNWLRREFRTLMNRFTSNQRQMSLEYASDANRPEPNDGNRKRAIRDLAQSMEHLLVVHTDVERLLRQKLGPSDLGVQRG